MHAPVGAARFAQQFGGAVGQHLVRIHVVRRAGARLIHVDDELVAQASREDFVGGRHDRARHVGIETPERGVGLGRRFLDEDGRGDEIAGARRPLMGKFSTARAVCTP